ncbi:MAG: hypothetical protein AB8B72_02715 [Crocinitomicaceae bacterium]
MTTLFKIFSVVLISTLSCQSGDMGSILNNDSSTSINCSNEACTGNYYGREFIGKSDVAHQFSNHMAKAVGDHLKKLYKIGSYSKVDLKNIVMITDGMNNRDSVHYQLYIPFIAVSDSCEAATAFDHRGGWGHEIAESAAIDKFKNKRKFKYIELKTPEGLQEFWLQWQHNSWQIGCK